MSRKIDWESQIGRRLKLRDLHVFFTVAQHGSMAKAAQRLGVSQPAVSEVIADLERALGVRLFDRHPQGIEPTIYGDSLLRRSIAVFDELKQGVRDIEFLADPSVGELRIASVESISATFLPEVVQRFFKKYPRVLLHVEDMPTRKVALPGLHDRKFDIVFGRPTMPLPDDRLGEDLNAEFLCDDPFVVVAGADTKWARRRKIDLAELVGEPWLLTAPPGWTYVGVEQAFRARGLGMPKVNLMSLSVPLRAHLVENGPFITVYPRMVMRLMRDRGLRLKELPVDLPSEPWPIMVLTLRNRTLSPLVGRFVECAREVGISVAGRPRSGTTSASPANRSGKSQAVADLPIGAHSGSLHHRGTAKE
jgi:DNA-binding transcriptional LysR family regulator